MPIIILAIFVKLYRTREALFYIDEVQIELVLKLRYK